MARNLLTRGRFFVPKVCAAFVSMTLSRLAIKIKILMRKKCFPRENDPRRPFQLKTVSLRLNSEIYFSG